MSYTILNDTPEHAQIVERLLARQPLEKRLQRKCENTRMRCARMRADRASRAHCTEILHFVHLFSFVSKAVLEVHGGTVVVG